MIRKSVVAALAAASALLPFAAAADYRNSYAEWRALSDAGREGFVMGALDWVIGAIPLSTDESPWINMTLAATECVKERVKPTSGMMVEAVTDAYRANPDLWEIPPAIMLQYALHRICGPEIARRARAAGQSMMTADALLAALKDLINTRRGGPSGDQPRPSGRR